jgi:hypothetical protein
MLYRGCWEEAESRRAADTATERGQLEVTRQWVWRRRGGLGGDISSGVLGTAATWVASTGSRAAEREAQTPRLVGACERQARVFLGGALRCLACGEMEYDGREAGIGAWLCGGGGRYGGKRGVLM